MSTRGLIGLAALLMTPTLAEGQSVRGAVLDKGTGGPVSGIVVALLDSAGSVMHRDLTDSAGRYRLRAPRSGVYRIRTLRVGFSPFTSEPFAMGAVEEIQRQITVASVALRLDTIRVVGRNSCRSLDDSSAVIFRLWEQAQTALTAAKLSNARSLRASIVTYQRWEHPTRDHVLEEQRQVMSGVTRSPWHSIGPDSVRAVGYVTLDANGWTTYHAPDLDVLLSNSFVEDHCFRLADASAGTGLIGIAFEPTQTRRNLPEIEGTIWVDRASSELQRMEFEYVNVPRTVRAARAGGNVEFVRLRDGTRTVSRWSLRFPEIDSRQTRTGAHFKAGTVTEEYVSRVRVEGGELALLMRRSDTLWTATVVTNSSTDRAVQPAQLPAPSIEQLPPSRGLSRATLHGFISNEHGAPLPRVEVAIASPRMVAVSDDSGRFRIGNIPAGRYELTARRVGYREFSDVIDVPESGIVDGRIVLRAVTELQPIEVTADRAMTEFDENRRIGLGKFMDRSELEKQEQRKLPEILEGLGVKSYRLGPRAWVGSSRGPRGMSLGGASNLKCSTLEGRDVANRDINNPNKNPGCGCFAQIYLDGAPLYKGESGGVVPDMNMIVPQSLEAIEYYKSAAQTPLKYSTLNSQCGVLVLHTRRTPGRVKEPDSK
jgi:hypothetical protein